jgi:DNA polymerase III gamma/tau subunit
MRHVAPQDASIHIDAVRELRQFVKLKPTSASQTTSRVVLIEDAHCLTDEAQNFLLKLLEEPPSGLVLLLTATSAQALLPTIQSRVASLAVRAPLASDSADYFARQNYNASAIRQASLLGNNLPGLMQALLADASHPLHESVASARHLLAASAFEKLCQVDSLAKQKDASLRLSYVLQRMAQAALETAASQASARKKLADWHRIYRAAYQAEADLRASVNPKLALTNLMLSL